MLIPPVVATLLADTTEFSAKMTEAQAKMAETEGKGSSSMSKLQSVGKVAFLAIAAGAVAVGVAAVDMEMKYEASTAKMAGSANISIAAANNIGAAFLGQAFKTTFSAQQTMTAYAGVAGQLGTMQGKALTATQALGFMTQAQDLAEASGNNLDTTTASLAKVMQAFQLPVSQAAAATDVLFNTSVATGVGISTLATQLSKARGMMGAAAPPIGVLSGLLLDLTAHGVSGRAAMSTLTGAFTGIINPTKAVAAAQQAMGVSFINAKTHGLDPLPQILATAGAAIAGMGSAQATATLKTLGFGAASGKLVATIQAGPAVLTKYIDQVTKTGAAHAAAEKSSNTLEGQEKKLGAGFSDLVTSLGTYLIPILHTLVSVGVGVVTWLSQNQTVALALAAVVGGVLLAAMGAFTVSLFTAGGALAFLISPITAVVVAIGLVVVAFTLLYTHVAIFKTVVDSFVSIVKGVFAGAIAFITTIVGDVTKFITSNWTTIQTVTTVIFDVIKTYFTVWWNIISTLFKVELAIVIGVLQVAWTVISTAVKVAWDIISTTIGTAITVIIGFVKGIIAIVSFLTGVWQTVTSAVSGFVGGVVTFFVNLPGQILNALSSLSTLLVTVGYNLIMGLKNGIANAWNSVTSFIKGIPGQIAGWFGSILGIHSPSTVFAGFGANIIQGLQQGIAGQMGSLQATMAGVSTAVSGNLSATIMPTAGGATAAAGRVAAGAAVGGGITVYNTYHMPITGDVSPQTVATIQTMLEQERQNLHQTLDHLVH